MQRTPISHRNTNITCENCKQKLGEVAKALNVDYAYFTHRTHGRRGAWCARCGKLKEDSRGNQSDKLNHFSEIIRRARLKLFRVWSFH